MLLILSAGLMINELLARPLPLGTLTETHTFANTVTYSVITVTQRKVVSSSTLSRTVTSWSQVATTYTEVTVEECPSTVTFYTGQLPCFTATVTTTVTTTTSVTT